MCGKTGEMEIEQKLSARVLERVNEQKSAKIK